jgi:hypothetical protein
MKSKLRIAAILMCALIIGGAFVPASSQSEKKIRTEDVPAAVRSAFVKAYPNARITGASREMEGEQAYYEIESIDGSIHRDLLYTPIGGVHEIEETVAAELLPEGVRNTLKKQFSKASIEKAERSVRGSEIHYEVLLKRAKKIYEISLDPSGKILSKETRNEKKGTKVDDSKDDDD